MGAPPRGHHPHPQHQHHQHPQPAFSPADDRILLGAIDRLHTLLTTTDTPFKKHTLPAGIRSRLVNLVHSEHPDWLHDRVPTERRISWLFKTRHAADQDPAAGRDASAAPHPLLDADRDRARSTDFQRLAESGGPPSPSPLRSPPPTHPAAALRPAGGLADPRLALRGSMLAVPLPPLPLASSRRVNLAAAGRDPARLDPAGLGGPLPWLSDPQDAADDGASSPETRRPLVSLGDAASDRFAALAAARDDQDSDEDDWAAGKARLLKKPTNLWSRLEAASASDGMDPGHAAPSSAKACGSGATPDSPGVREGFRVAVTAPEAADAPLAGAAAHQPPLSRPSTAPSVSPRKRPVGDADADGATLADHDSERSMLAPRPRSGPRSVADQDPTHAAPAAQAAASAPAAAVAVQPVTCDQPAQKQEAALPPIPPASTSAPALARSTRSRLRSPPSPAAVAAKARTSSHAQAVGSDPPDYTSPPLLGASDAHDTQDTQHTDHDLAPRSQPLRPGRTSHRTHISATRSSSREPAVEPASDPAAMDAAKTMQSPLSPPPGGGPLSTAQADVVPSILCSDAEPASPHRQTRRLRSLRSRQSRSQQQQQQQQQPQDDQSEPRSRSGHSTRGGKHVSTGKSGVSAVLEDPKFDDSHDADPMLDDDNDDVEDQAQVPVHRKHSERIAAQRNRVSKAKPTASVVVRGRKQGSAVIGV
ncbi:hypothetical protein HK105_201102 [Polyrhizophydium stewartii]|uniref:Uncharacterized protein n=1 Tax=Polyrhizophydium stewartii TaxID=2732419 RepID=A0ABR4NJ20_9FUNG